MAMHNEGRLLAEDGDAALGGVDAEGLLHQAGPRELGEAQTVEMQKSQAELAKPQELQASKDQVAQVSTAVGNPSLRVALWVMLSSLGQAVDEHSGATGRGC